MHSIHVHVYYFKRGFNIFLKGLAQIYCNGEWGTICGDNYYYYGIGDIEADTVCRQLGYTGSSSTGHLDLLVCQYNYMYLYSIYQKSHHTVQ